MIVKIVRKFAEGADGPFKPISEVPDRVLLETDDGEGNPSGFPAIKISGKVFYFGKPHDKVKNYRVLALYTDVVCIQE